MLLPRAGASYHIIREGFGPVPGLRQDLDRDLDQRPRRRWPASPSLFGEFACRGCSAPDAPLPPAAWGAIAIAGFAADQPARHRVGQAHAGRADRRQARSDSSRWSSAPLPAAPAAPDTAAADERTASLLAFLSLIGLGVAAVLFTYDGWVDVTHVAGEVREPRRNLPLALGARRRRHHPALPRGQLRLPSRRRRLPGMREEPAAVAAPSPWRPSGRRRPAPERPHHRSPSWARSAGWS